MMTILRILVMSGFVAAAMSSSASGGDTRRSSGAHDFDFLVGEWRVHHHQLQPDRRTWLDFDGWCSNRPLAGGAANMEEHLLNKPGGTYRAVALRASDSKSGRMAIWWVDSRNPSRPLDPPVIGRFENGIGTFYNDYMQDGRQMRGRFLWSNITKTSARFEQSASSDDGRTWAPNWIMNFERVKQANLRSRDAGGGVHDFDGLAGDWRVHHRYLRMVGDKREWADGFGTARHHRVMEGVANVEEHTIDAPAGTYYAIALRSFDRAAARWSVWWIDGRNPLTGIDPPMRGRVENGGGTFFGETMVNDRSTPTRFVWSGMTTESPRWEQAYSPDSGQTWETNWIMEFQRKHK
jgi:hypothetical protein